MLKFTHFRELFRVRNDQVSYPLTLSDHCSVKHDQVDLVLVLNVLAHVGLLLGKLEYVVLRDKNITLVNQLQL